ncbi:MAG: ABC transporter permease [Thermoproteota archaeon]
MSSSKQILSRSWSTFRKLMKIKKFFAGMSIFLSIVLTGVIGPLIYNVDPNSKVGFPTSPPSSKFPLGTDHLGRDVLANLLSGIRNSLFIGSVAMLIALTIGVSIGSIAGFRGGVVDEILMMFTNIVYTLPSILLMILAASYLKTRTPLIVSLIIGFTSWPWLARAVRAQIMSLKEREFLYMSKMSGMSSSKIIFQDLLPNMGSYIFMSIALLLSIGMVSEAGLSMLNAGVTEGSSLGIMLYWASVWQAIQLGYWWWFVPPGLFLILTTTSLLLLSTSVDEYLNPRLRGGK